VAIEIIVARALAQQSFLQKCRTPKQARIPIENFVLDETVTWQCMYLIETDFHFLPKIEIIVP